jgi:hypothetical protein
VLVLSVTHARQFKRNRVTTTTSRNGCQNGALRRQLHYPTGQPSGGHPPRTRQGILRLLEPPNSHSTCQRNPFQRLHVKIVIIGPYCEAYVAAIGVRSRRDHCMPPLMGLMGHA